VQNTLAPSDAKSEGVQMLGDDADVSSPALQAAQELRGRSRLRKKSVAANVITTGPVA
jgi:hypothetical protein